jgi:hypothetical protein
VRKRLQLASENALIVVHDANRRPCEEAFTLFDKGLLLHHGRENSGGFWIGVRGSIRLEDLIDVPGQTVLWNLYARIGRYIKI